MTATPATEGWAGDGVGREPHGRQVLVVGVDGSAPSWDAFAWAAGEARRCHGRIIAVFVSPLVEPEGALAVVAPFSYAGAAEAREQAADRLAEEVAARGVDVGVEVSFVRAKGDPAHVLTQAALSAHADVIVVGRSTKLLHRLVGSISRRLVLSQDVPVVVVVP